MRKSRNEDWLLTMTRVFVGHSTVLLLSLRFGFTVDHRISRQWASRSFGSKTLPEERDLCGDRPF
jgi:hypothetical protein